MTAGTVQLWSYCAKIDDGGSQFIRTAEFVSSLTFVPAAPLIGQLLRLMSDSDAWEQKGGFFFLWLYLRTQHMQ